MTKRIKWTKGEDKILVRAIKAHPHNKTKAFVLAAKKVNHSKKSCQSRWYNKLSNPESKHYVGCIFTMLCAPSKLENRTTSIPGSYITPSKVEKGLWSKIKKLLGIKK